MLQKNWQADFEAYKKRIQNLEELLRRVNGDLPADFAQKAQDYIQQCKKMGRTLPAAKPALITINAFQPMLPELIGGSADLAGSNLTLFNGAKGIDTDADGNFIYYGVREFGMTAIANGIARCMADLFRM